MLMEMLTNLTKYHGQHCKLESGTEDWKEFLKVFNFGEEKCLNLQVR